MESEEKYNRVKNLFDQQKQILSELNIENYFESMIKIRLLEVQKDMTIAIPKYKKGGQSELAIIGNNEPEMFVDKNGKSFIIGPSEKIRKAFE
jgi:hypothetical protein